MSPSSSWRAIHEDTVRTYKSLGQVEQPLIKSEPRPRPTGGKCTASRRYSPKWGLAAKTRAEPARAKMQYASTSLPSQPPINNTSSNCSDSSPKDLYSVTGKLKTLHPQLPQGVMCHAPLELQLSPPYYARSHDDRLCTSARYSPCGSCREGRGPNSSRNRAQH